MAWQPTGKIQPTIYIFKVLLEYSRAHSLLSMAAFMLQWQSWAISKEIIWSTKSKIFTNLTFIESLPTPVPD